MWEAREGGKDVGEAREGVTRHTCFRRAYLDSVTLSVWSSHLKLVVGEGQGREGMRRVGACSCHCVLYAATVDCAAILAHATISYKQLDERSEVQSHTHVE